MLAGDFARKIKKLNPSLNIFTSNDDSKPAGLFIVQNSEYIQICGVDKNYLPEYPVFTNDGHIVKSGWKRIVNILISGKWINKNEAKRVFNTSSFHIPKHLNKQHFDMFKYIDPDRPLTKNDVFDLATKMETK